jgi:PAS domain S-box-containing protein
MIENKEKSSIVFKKIINNLSDLIAHVGRDKRYIFANKSYCKMFNISQDEIKGKHICDILGEKIFKVINPRIEKVLAGDETFYEDIFPLQDGKKIFFHVEYYPFKDDSGKVESFVVHARDITQQKQAEKIQNNLNEELEKKVLQRTIELQTANHHFNDAALAWQATFDAVDDIIVIINKENRILQANKAARKLSPENDILEKKCCKVFHGTDSPPKNCPASKLFDKGESVHLEYQESSLNNHWLSLYAYPIKNNDGQTVKLIHVIRDINDRKIAQKELADAKTMAERHSKAKSRFLAKMSHEVRTPLNAIQGIGNLLGKRIKDKEQKKLLQLHNNSASHLSNLLGDILDLSRIEAEQLGLNKEVFNLINVCNDTIKIFSSQAANKGLSLTISITGDSSSEWFMGDQLRIKQIIYNLIGNSIKFVEKGSISLSLELKEKEKEKEKEKDKKQKIILVVADTGPGIAPEALETIFKPFCQGNINNSEGSGLGLTITKELVELLGGKIEVSSKIGQGTVFRIEFLLPQACPPEEVSKDKEKQILPGRVLIIDDVYVNRHVLAMVMADDGWQTQEAASGQEALDILINDINFDLIFMDISMPGLDGVETAREIKNNQICRHIPVIAQTAHAVVGDREQFLQKGFDGYIAKPVDQEQLQNEITRVLTNDRQLLTDKITEKTNGDSQEKLTEAYMGPIDFQELLIICRGKEKLAKRLTKAIIQEVPDWQAELTNAIEEQDGLRIREICHKIKGSAGTCCAKDLAAGAEALGQVVREDEMEKIPEKLTVLKNELTRLMALNDQNEWKK